MTAEPEKRSLLPALAAGAKPEANSVLGKLPTSRPASGLAVARRAARLSVSETSAAILKREAIASCGSSTFGFGVSCTTALRTRPPLPEVAAAATAASAGCGRGFGALDAAAVISAGTGLVACGSICGRGLGALAAISTAFIVSLAGAALAIAVAAFAGLSLSTLSNCGRLPGVGTA